MVSLKMKLNQFIMKNYNNNVKLIDKKNKEYLMKQIFILGIRRKLIWKLSFLIKCLYCIESQ